MIRESEIEITKQLIALYKEAFCGPPRNETWTDEEVQALFLDEKEKGGRLLSYTEKQQLVGFASYYPADKSEILEELNLENRSGYYLSQMAVSKNFRGKGIAKKFLAFLLKKQDCTIWVRTRLDAGAVNHLLRTCRFIVAEQYIDTVGNSRAKRYIWRSN